MINLDAIEKGYYEVVVDEIKVSQHSKPLKAIARAQEEKAKNKDAYIYVKQPNIEPVVEVDDNAIVDELLAEIEQLKNDYDMIWAEFERYKTLHGGDPVEIAVESVTVTPSTASISVGNTQLLTAIISPVNATNQNGVWSSDNANSTVSEAGLVTAVTEGSSIISFITTDGSFTDSTTVTVTPAVAETLKAFPSAIGAGADTIGGRDATQIIHVTTLDWAAAGGLKEAIQTTGARTIVFDVSGEIDATAEGIFTNLCTGSAYDNLTIAGQTAPEGGITIKTSFFRFIDVSNIVFRYLTFRHDESVNNYSTLWFFGCSDYVVDHCTISHGGDEAFDNSSSSTQGGNGTVQNCFYQSSSKGGIFGTDSREQIPPLSDSGKYTYANNLHINISHRFPNPQGNGQYDIINNVVYNWKERLVRITQGGTYNVINNYYKPATEGLLRPSWGGADVDLTGRSHKVQLQVADNPLIYTTGDKVTNNPAMPLVDGSGMWTVFAGSDEAIVPIGDPVPAQYFTGTQFPLAGQAMVIKTAAESYTDLVTNNNAGSTKTLDANGTILDSRDSKHIGDILMIENDTFVSYDLGFTYFPLGEVPYPIIPVNTRPVGYYVSNAHIPEAYLIANGLPQTADVHLTKNATGYTYLEVFMNEVDA